jgi:hypothetical protein
MFFADFLREYLFEHLVGDGSADMSELIVSSFDILLNLTHDICSSLLCTSINPHAHYGWSRCQARPSLGWARATHPTNNIMGKEGKGHSMTLRSGVADSTISEKKTCSTSSSSRNGSTYWYMSSKWTF